VPPAPVPPPPADLVDPGGLGGDGDDDDDGDGDGDGDAPAAAPPFLPETQPSAASLAAAAGAALRAAASSPGGAADPAIWSALADLNAVTGFPTAAREARLKAVRCLAGSDWREEAGAFASYAAAAAALGRAEAAAAATTASTDPGAGGTPRDLASARLLLKGLVGAGVKLQEDGVEVGDALAEAQAALDGLAAV